MKNVPLTAGILATALLTAGPFAAPLKAEEMYGESVEWLVADSDLIIQGTVAAVPPTSPDALYGDITLTETETLKGEAPERLTFNARVDGTTEVLERLRRQEASVLAFLKRGQLRQVIVPAGEKVQPPIYNWMFWRGAITMDGRALWQADEVLQVVHKAVEYGAGRPAPKPVDIDVPFSSDAWSILYAGSGVHLAVPLDGRLGALARRWVEGEDGFLREEGARLLKLFEAQGIPPDEVPDTEETALLRHASGLVLNGGFEQRLGVDPPNYIEPLGPGVADLTGWGVIDGIVDWIGPARWRAAEGRQCLDLDAPGAIRQVLATVPGRMYVLAFDLAGNPETEPAAKHLVVEAGGQKQTFTFDATGRTPDQMGWTRRRIVFRAEAERTAIVFVNASPEPTASGVALDNVSVHAIERGPPDEAGPSGRYSLATAGEKIVLLDSATGRTWLLTDGEQGPVWQPIDRPDAANGTLINTDPH